MKSLISKNVLRKKEEERRTKQSLDLPQTIEANKKKNLRHYKHKKFISYFSTEFKKTIIICPRHNILYLPSLTGSLHTYAYIDCKIVCKWI